MSHYQTSNLRTWTSMEIKLDLVHLFPLLFASLILVHSPMAGAQKTTIPVNVGLVLNMDRWIGQMGLSCISMALSDFYASHDFYKTRVVLNVRDSKQDVIGAAAAALDLLKNVQVQAIIGPVSSMQAEFTIDLGGKAHVPILSFSATSPSLSSTRSPYFIRTTQNDSSQVKAISSIIKAFGWREVVPIYVNNEFGEGIIPFLSDALDEVNARVSYRSVIPPSATDDQIVAELYKLMTMQTRVFIVHMLADLGSRLFVKAKELGMLSQGYAWIITDAMTVWLNSIDPSSIASMQGVIGVKPHVPQTKELESFTNRWKLKFQEKNPRFLNPQLNVFGLWAYDSATALAMAIEKAGAKNLGFQKPRMSRNSTELETGISNNGPFLLQEILKTTFRALSGDFQLVDGQLQSTAYEIVNVIGTGAKEVGFWTPENGIVRQLINVRTKNMYSTSKANLGTIVWPGDTTLPPKGWIIPTTGKKLRVLVPVKDGFSEFLTVTRDSSTNETMVTGYCIDVFDAAIASLPYAVPYEYIVYSKPDGKIAGTYNDLVHQVYLGKYDAAVGDITIVANRSKYVDFTLPFTESGISMIVRTKANDSKNPWVFLKPLTRNLWITISFSFLIIGALVWLFENRINEEFRGPISHQVGTTFWFAFCGMVFAHREKIVSNYTRFVLIFWFLAVLILTQAYTASLTSMLTVQKLQPAITDINELIRNKEYVGYQKGSFILGFLKRMGFDESRLQIYNSPYELDQLFENGSKNGGISAAFDEIPYAKVFLSRYCSKYTVVQPTYKIDGFGFVFPIGSPLLTEVSRAILNVTEGDKMVKIENAWFPRTSCPDSTTSLITSNSLGLGSFRGLFLIVGVAAGLALITYLVVSFYKHSNADENRELSIRGKLNKLFEQFHTKDLSSHTFRSIELRIERRRDGDDGERMIITSSALNRALNLLLQAPQDAVASNPSPPCQSQEHPSTSSGSHSKDEGTSSGQSKSGEVVPALELTDKGHQEVASSEGTPPAVEEHTDTSRGSNPRDEGTSSAQSIISQENNS